MQSIDRQVSGGSAPAKARKGGSSSTSIKARIARRRVGVTLAAPPMTTTTTTAPTTSGARLLPPRMSSASAAARLQLLLLLVAALAAPSQSYYLPVCHTDAECSSESFCAPKTELRGDDEDNKLSYGFQSRCLPCWLCCSLQGTGLLPLGSSECPSQCDCAAGDRCGSNSDCSNGEVCSSEGVCASCLSCDESAGGASGCSPACGQLRELVTHLEDRRPPSSDLFLLPSSPDAIFAQRWLTAYTGAPQPASKVIESANWNPNARISPWTLLTAAASFRDTCFAAPGSRSFRKVVSPGCPCDPDSTAESGNGICPVGSYCSSSGGSALNAGAFICLPCPTGTFCAPGTSRISDVTTQLCPEGHYCPSPSEKIACRAGDFCPLGSTKPSSCEYLTLFAEERSTVRIFQETNVLSELVYGRRPWGGNTCGPKSPDPFTDCPGGSFCPDPSSSQICPAGSKCPSPSQEPQECSSLILQCSEGSSGGSVSILGIIICLALSVGLLLIIVSTRLAYGLLQRRQTKAVQKTDAYMKVKRIILETRASLHPSYLQKLLKSPMKTCEMYLRSKGVVELEFENLGLKLKNGKTVLDGVSGRFESRKLVAIMGPSGAGKSTFLNVLCGKADTYGKTTGTLRINGEEAKSVNANPGKRAVGFVPQDDIVHEDLTVRENIWLSASARLPTYLTKRQKERIVQEVLFSLKLEHIEHSVVGSVEQRGISGGQRKRVNIGLELTSLPTLLFLDEPTSGLDSTASTDVMDTLKQCAKLGMTVMTVIHQPRYTIFTSFDDVLFLGRGGRTVYLGPTQYASTYFQDLGFSLPANDNPADFCIDVLSGGMRRDGDLNFKPDDLFDVWNKDGVKAVEGFLQAELLESQQLDAPTAGASARGYVGGRTTEVMPRDVQCMANIFRDIDTDGDGMVTPEQVMDYFRAMDLKMDEREVRKFCAGNPSMSKADFLALMRNGPVEDEPHRRRKKRGKGNAKKRGGRNYDAPRGFTACIGRPSYSSSGLKNQGPPPAGAQQTTGPSELAADEATSQEVAVVITDAPPASGQSSDSSPPSGFLSSRDGLPESEPMVPADGSENGAETPVHHQAGADDSGPWAENRGHEEEDSGDDEAADDSAIPEEATDGFGRLEKRTVRFNAPSSSSSDSVAASSPGRPGTLGLSKLSIRTDQSGFTSDYCDSPDIESTGSLSEGGDSPLPQGGNPSKPHRFKCYTDLTRAAVQFVLITYTRAIQWVRSWSSKVLTYIMLAIAGSLLGIILRRHNNKDVVPLRSLLAQLTLALLCGIPSLQVFSNARAMWWRERSSGFSPTGHVMAGMFVDTFDVVIRPMVFNSMFYFFVLPYISFWDSYTVLLGTSWYASGLAYAFSSLMAPGSASVALVCCTMVIGGLFSGVLPFLTSLRSIPFLYHLHSISFTRWGSEALTILEYAGQQPYQQPPLAITLYGIGYCDMDIKLESLGKQIDSGLRLVLESDEVLEQVSMLRDALESSIEGGESFIGRHCAPYVRRDLLWLFLLGLGFRLVAFLAMRWMGRRA